MNLVGKKKHTNAKKIFTDVNLRKQQYTQVYLCVYIQIILHQRNSVFKCKSQGSNKWTTIRPKQQCIILYNSKKLCSLKKLGPFAHGAVLTCTWYISHVNQNVDVK